MSPSGAVRSRAWPLRLVLFVLWSQAAQSQEAVQQGRLSTSDSLSARLPHTTAWRLDFRAPIVQQWALSWLSEPSYIAGGGGAGPWSSMLFEGNIAPHLTFSGRSWRLEGTPKIIIRMLRSESAPVRSPSFMPRLTLYYWGRRGGWLTRESQDTLRMLSLTISHHSNGQARPLVDTLTGEIDPLGSFSTNYVEIASHWVTDAFDDGAGRPSGLLAARTGFRFHVPVNEDQALRDYRHGRFQYGRYRILESLTGFLAPPWLGGDKLVQRRTSHRATIAFQYMVDPKVLGTANYFHRDRVVYFLTVAGFARWLREVGWFAQYYNGADYYNIQYTHHLSVIRGGFTIESRTELSTTDAFGPPI